MHRIFSPSVDREPGVRLGALAGVELRLDWSLLVIFALITIDLGAVVFPSWHPGWTRLTVWSTALAAALLFFASVLAHELAHAAAARVQGLGVRSVTLFLFGGLAQLEHEPDSPRSEFWIALAGPLTSLAIGLLASVAGVWIAGDALVTASRGGSATEAQGALAALSPLSSLLLWLGPVNLVLGLFNLVPGFPLDGGRALRAVLWGITDDRRAATRWASWAGRGFSWLLMGLGVLELFRGSLIAGLWLLAIGWFLNRAAKAGYLQAIARDALDGVPVGRLMRTSFVRLRPSVSVEDFVSEHAMNTDQIDFPVDSEGRVLGLVNLGRAQGVKPQRWPELTVAEIMIPASDLDRVPPQFGADQALARLERERSNRLLVTDSEGSLLGLLRRHDFIRWLSVHAWTGDGAGRKEART